MRAPRRARRAPARPPRRGLAQPPSTACDVGADLLLERGGLARAARPARGPSSTGSSPAACCRGWRRRPPAPCAPPAAARAGSRTRCDRAAARCSATSPACGSLRSINSCTCSWRPGARRRKLAHVLLDLLLRAREAPHLRERVLDVARHAIGPLLVEADRAPATGGRPPRAPARTRWRRRSPRPGASRRRPRAGPARCWPDPARSSSRDSRSSCRAASSVSSASCRCRAPDAPPPPPPLCCGCRRAAAGARLPAPAAAPAPSAARASRRPCCRPTAAGSAGTSRYWLRSLSASSWNRSASSSAARRSPAAAPTAAALLAVHPHAHVAVGFLGALQARERLLLRRQRVLRVARLQLLLGGLHRLTAAASRWPAMSFIIGSACADARR